MCGIAGLLRYGERAERDIEVMKERMAHRGPDAGGTWRDADDDVFFGHRRLAVLDLSETGAQPMRSASGRFVICYNGEIYNLAALRKKLLEKGIRDFRGTSDTELLLEALEHLGISETLACVKGMFAIALFDTHEKTLTLIRDRVGQKPLYYGFVNDAFVFASDLGSISALSAFQNPVNTKVLRLYFLHGYIPAPYSIYEDIWKLQPGCVLTLPAPYTRESISVSPFWSMRDAALHGVRHPFPGSFEEASAELERLITASVSEQVVADVPVGAFLSGGIDSATTVAMMQTVTPGRVKSFTIGMEDPEFNEAQHAKEIAAHLGTTHTELYITDADARAVIPLLPAMYAEPFADSSQIPTYLVSKMTRQHVTVSLSGDGGDELFAGYNMYRHMQRIYQKIKGIPYPIRRAAGGVLRRMPFAESGRMQVAAALVDSRDPEDLYRNFYFRAEKLKQQIAKDASLPAYAFSPENAAGDVPGEPVKDWMLMDLLLYHPDDILVKVDRAAMAVSLETRIPLLDRDVMEFAWTLPLSYLYDEHCGKRILRDVLYRHVPREMMERPKTGFAVPVMKWLKDGELREWAEGLLDETKIRAQGFLRAETVRRIWRDLTERGIWRAQIWYILMFQAWLEGNSNGRLS